MLSRADVARLSMGRQRHSKSNLIIRADAQNLVADTRNAIMVCQSFMMVGQHAS
jgi:hypothetical protein